jgi:2-keto-4-pentenoate hydratase/2-oxohepta-3-ene-1,7-dioic acid hydratase in catechol pathway
VQHSLRAVGSLLPKVKAVGPDGARLIYRFDESACWLRCRAPTSCGTPMVFHERQDGTPVIPDVFFEWPPTSPRAAPSSPDHPMIVKPRFTEQLDFEVEFGAIIGKKGINITQGEAESHIAGFTIYNDISARDVQFREMEMMLGPAKGKNFEGANIMGPCLVTLDEIDYDNLRMIARVNGETIVDDNSSAMYHKFPRLIEWISQEEYLYPGDFIASGTCDHGTAMTSTLKRWLQVGDVMEIEIPGIGIIRNEVVASPR